MRTIIAIAKKEVAVNLATPWAWTIFTAVTFISSFFFIGLLGNFKEAHEQVRLQGGWDQQGPEAQALRNLTDGVVMPLLSTMLVVLLFVVPFLSVRVIAEERRQKTFELLMTSPVTSTEIVIGKYLGGLAIIVATIALLLVYPLALTAFGASFSATTAERTTTLEWPVVMLGMLALVLWAAAIHAIGTFISSLTESVIVAGLVTLALSLIWFIVKLVAPNADGAAGTILNYISFDSQFRNLLRGVLDLQPLVFFSSVIAFFLLATHRSIELRRWV